MQNGGGACPADLCLAGSCKSRRVTGSLFCSDACTLAHAAASVRVATGHDINEVSGTVTRWVMVLAIPRGRVGRVA